MTSISGSFSGLGSGLDINSMISTLMDVEKNSQRLVAQKQKAVQNRLDAYNALNDQLGVIRSAATGLRRPFDWNLYSATSSDSDIATASTTSSAVSGNLSFKVDRLATAHSVRSIGSVASMNSVIASGTLVIGAAAGLGFASLSGSIDLAGGKHTFEVTQASAAATKTADDALPEPTTITAGTNDTLEVTIDGVATTLTFAPGTYTRHELAQEFSTLTDGALTATLDESNHLVLSTAREGTAASIQVTGGLAVSDMGLTVDGAASTGTDGIVAVDGTVTKFTDIQSGLTFSAAAGVGSVGGTFSGGLRVGKANVANVSLGSGTLSAVVSAINNSGAGVSATAIKVGTDTYRLQLASQSSGTSGRLTFDASLFSGMGGSTVLDVGTDASITVGGGEGAFTVTSSSNRVRDVIPGVEILLKKTSTDPVTISVSPDGSAVATKIQAVVDETNRLFKAIADLTKYDTTKKQASVLTGDGTIRRLQSSITLSVTSAVAASAVGSAGLVGLSAARNGTLTFDKSKFLDQFNADPAAVRSLFTTNLSATNASVSLSSAGERTKAGTYAVVISTAAAKATRQGADLSGAGQQILGPETIDVKVGSTTISYAASAGESLTSIASGLNAALGSAGLTPAAAVESGRLVLRSANFGATEKFSVRTDNADGGQTGIASTANAFEQVSGTDVAGTIAGRTASGRGQVLALDANDAELPLFALAISTTETGDLGTVTFDPGVAHRLTQTVLGASDPVSGSLTTAINGKKSEIDSLSRVDADWTRRLAEREKRLRAQFATLDTALGALRSQGSWISSQLGSLNNNRT
ncbi:MAG: flagellar filament capping protein FliD [Acidimicrobiia bacterium]